MTTASNPYLLWAKLPNKDKESRAFHPLICHMLDVAAVTRKIWRNLLPEMARRRIAESLKLSATETERWITYLAALHDLGKASPAFQLRKEATHLWKIYESFGNPPNIEAKDCPHGRVTAGETPQILEEEFGLEKHISNRLAVIIGGHHGTFPTSYELLNRCPDAGVGKTNKWKQIRRELALQLGRMFDISKESVPCDCDHASAMFIAGLVSVADWIGSNSDFFPYLVNDFDSLPMLDPADYLLKTETGAAKALSRLGWLGWRQPDTRLAFSQLFPFIVSPRPLQLAAAEIAEKIQSPGIVIIEAPMGEGKTEAALFLADNWGVAPGPRGWYLALPTQATSNQMFIRVRDFLSARYPTENVNLQLLHGHASLSSEFGLLLENGDKVFELASVCGEESLDSQSSSVVAAEWFTHRKRGLLAPFGVGTVDQALLAVLQTRHVFVRLFGLSHKIVIVDEVHAYDTYMSKLLERLLEWLAALGSPVILLSATLPNEKRVAMLKAYKRGLGRELSAEEEQQLEVRYPRLSWTNGTIQGGQTIEISDRIRRTLKIEWIDESLPLGKRLNIFMADGGCAAVICNTVNRAQQVYLSLKPYFAEDELDLFHARYLFKDRDEREKRALGNFGKDGATIKFNDDEERIVCRPHRKILVATQVIEQSLDLDFDLMVTDCAPVDLILQRSGRLHRHDRQRPKKLSQPTLWIRQVSVEDGLPMFDPGSEAIYDPHVLLRSWLILQSRNEIEIPAQIEELIEAVYGRQSSQDLASDKLREYWEKTAAKLHEDLKSMEAEAQRVVLPEPNYQDDILDINNKRLEEDEPEVHKSLQALTRLAEPNVSVICLKPDQRRRFNLSAEPTVSMAKDLLRYSVTLSSKLIVWTLLAQKSHSAWSKSALLRPYRLLELDEAGCCNIGKYQIQIHPELGVTINERGKEQNDPFIQPA